MENSTNPYKNVHSRYRLRKGINFIMMAGTGLCMLLAVIPLLWIFGYVMAKGAPSLSIGFFTQLPTPAGIPGGGLANALIGSAMTVGLGLLIAAPTGILAGLFMSANPRSQVSTVLRFATDVISGVPSIVMGIFAYTLIVLPQKHFSAFSGGVVLSFIMVPTIIRTVEEMLRLVPSFYREGSLALGRFRMAHLPFGRCASGREWDHYGTYVSHRQGSRRSCANVIYGFW